MQPVRLRLRVVEVALVSLGEGDILAPPGAPACRVEKVGGESAGPSSRFISSQNIEAACHLPAVCRFGAECLLVKAN